MISDLRIVDAPGRAQITKDDCLRVRPNRLSVIVEPEPETETGRIVLVRTKERAGAGANRSYAGVGRVVRMGERALRDGEIRAGARVVYAKGASDTTTLAAAGLHIVHHKSVLLEVPEGVNVEPLEHDL